MRRIARGLLLVGGLAALVLLVRGAGPERVLATVLEAGIWLPWILLLEVLFFGMDAVALRRILGGRGGSVPLAVWVRTALVQYGVMQLLPAGRTGGEVARAAGFAPYVGAAHAAAAAARLQAATLLGNTIISIPCWVAVAFATGSGSGLAWAVLVNGLVTLGIGGTIVLITRRSRLGAWLGRRFPMLASHGPSFDAALREPSPWIPVLLATTAGRLFQTVQYGLIFVSVGGAWTAQRALVAQGIHLVGAGMGDMVPNQVGITEGAYAVFAGALGLAEGTATAIGIALVARICQFSLAGVCLLVSALWKAPPAESPNTHASE